MIDEKVQVGDGSISNDENVIVHNLGTLNWNIYACIFEKHVTDEVIVTDEQLSCIQGKRPEAYEDAIHYVKDVLDSPDYIIRGKHPNTGLVIKKIPYGSDNNPIAEPAMASTNPSVLPQFSRFLTSILPAFAPSVKIQLSS